MYQGGALGYGIGAVVGQAVSWRVAFYVCGAPGFVLAFLALGLNNPVPGLNDNLEENEPENAMQENNSNLI